MFLRAIGSYFQTKQQLKIRCLVYLTLLVPEGQIRVSENVNLFSFVKYEYNFVNRCQLKGVNENDNAQGFKGKQRKEEEILLFLFKEKQGGVKVYYTILIEMYIQSCLLAHEQDCFTRRNYGHFGLCFC